MKKVETVEKNSLPTKEDIEAEKRLSEPAKWLSTKNMTFRLGMANSLLYITTTTTMRYKTVGGGGECDRYHIMAASGRVHAARNLQSQSFLLMSVEYFGLLYALLSQRL